LLKGRILAMAIPTIVGLKGSESAALNVTGGSAIETAATMLAIDHGRRDTVRCRRLRAVRWCRRGAHGEPWRPPMARQDHDDALHHGFIYQRGGAIGSKGATCPRGQPCRAALGIGYICRRRCRVPQTHVEGTHPVAAMGRRAPRPQGAARFRGEVTAKLTEMRIAGAAAEWRPAETGRAWRALGLGTKCFDARRTVRRIAPALSERLVTKSLPH